MLQLLKVKQKPKCSNHLYSNSFGTIKQTKTLDPTTDKLTIRLLANAEGMEAMEIKIFTAAPAHNVSTSENQMESEVYYAEKSN